MHTEELQSDEGATTDAGLDDEEEAFFQAPPPLVASVIGQDNQAQQIGDEGAAASGLSEEATLTDGLRGVSVVDSSDGLTKIWYVL